MSSLLKLGYFRELPHGDADGPSLREAIGTLHPDDKRRVTTYLDAGNVVATTAGAQTFDVLDAEHRRIGRLEILTDGIWAWPRDLSYYVRNYDVVLPVAFLTHAATSGWQMRTLSDAELEELSEQNHAIL